MKNKKTLFAIIGVIAIVIIAVIILQNNNTKDSQPTKTKPQKVLYTEPQIPEYGKKFKIFYNSEENIDKPVFELQFLIPQEIKIFNVAAKYDKEKKRYFAEFDVPHKSYSVAMRVKGLNESKSRRYAELPCKNDEDGAALRNYALDMMRQIKDYKKRLKIYENDSLDFPNLFERYIVKWKWPEIVSDTNVIADDIRELEKIKVNSEDAISYMSHSLVLMYGYAALGDIENFKKKIKDLDEKLTSNKIYLEYFKKIEAYYLVEIVGNSIKSILDGETKKIKDMGTEILNAMVELAGKHKINFVLYEFMRHYGVKKQLINSINNKHQFAEILLREVNAGLASKEYFNNAYDNIYLLVHTIELLNDINDRKFDGEVLKLINRSYGFTHKYRLPKFSKDTNDYCTIFNGYDGSYLDIIRLKGKWYLDRGDEESAISAYELGMNTEFTGKFADDIKTNIVNRVIDYYIKKKDLGKVEQYTLKLIEIEEKEGKQQFNKKVIPLRKELKEKVLTFDEFKRLNSVYTPPTKSAPNVNITHSSGTVNPSKMGDVDLVFVSIDEQCQRCNDDIPGIIEALSKKKNVKLFFITDISKKGIYNAFDHEVDVIKKNEPNLKAIYYDRYKDDRIIIVRKNKLYIEATTLTGKELVDKYF